jgi:hypothetical protein
VFAQESTTAWVQLPGYNCLFFYYKILAHSMQCIINW